jgi:exosome complex exonuclease DIS3/RRP44
LIRLRDLADTEPDSEFDAENYVLRTTGSREVQVELFEKVVVRISDIKEKSTGKRKVKLELVKTSAK